MERKERQKWRQWRETEIEVSNKGRVRSAKKHSHHFKPVLNNAGYELVHLTLDGISQMVPIHKMVAEAFLDNPEDLLEIDHINRCKTDNNASNLRYVSHRENCSNRGEYTRLPVKCYKDGVLIAIFRTAAQAKKMLGIRSDGVTACCKGYQMTCAGYEFSYDNGELEQLLLF